ncbi:hypothetical protein BH23ACT6_BH23ACT6_23380 [soil metagenome]
MTTTTKRAAPGGVPQAVGAVGPNVDRVQQTIDQGTSVLTSRDGRNRGLQGPRTAPRMEMALPCSYELPVNSTRILAGILLAEMRSRDRRPPEVA